MMFCFRKAILNIRRHWTKSVLAVATCMLIVVFLFLFFSGLWANLQQLEALPEALPIEAWISNLNGSLRSEILVKDTVIQGLEDSKFVKDLDYITQIAVVMGEVSEETASNIDQRDMSFPFGIGVNRMDAFHEIPAENFSFKESVGPEVLEGAEPVCVMSEQEMDKLGLSMGDTIRVTLFNTTYPNNNPMKKYNRLGVYEVEIIGSFRNSAGETATSNVQLIFPVQWLRDIHTQAGLLFFADSAHFKVENPLELNKFKTQMDELGLMSVISEANSTQHGEALIVYDETFVKTATRLKENITLTQLLTPFVVVIVGFLGFVSSYLLLQSRRPEIAIMRSLGLTRKSCFAMLFFESAVLELSGSLLGIVVASLLVDMSVALAVGVVFSFFVVYMAGTAVALIMLGRFSVMQVLSALD